MNISTKGIELIKQFEGLRLQAYKCSAEKNTIGYGHTEGVNIGDMITQEQADHFFQEDIKNVESTINALVTVQLTQNQFDALCSFVFNVGASDFEQSTLLKKLNASDYQGAAAELPKWDHVKGEESDGILRRRLAEQQLFLT